MTTETKCLPGEHDYQEFSRCRMCGEPRPNAPKPPEAPKFVDLGMGVPVEIRPAPAPEPKCVKCGSPRDSNSHTFELCFKCWGAEPAPEPNLDPLYCPVCKENCEWYKRAGFLNGPHPRFKPAAKCNCHGSCDNILHQSHSAPEPKGSEEPIDFDGAEEWLRIIAHEQKMGSDEDENALDAYLALRADLASAREEIKLREWDIDQATNRMKGRNTELAQAREEIARLKERIASMDEDITAFGEADMALTAICNRERAARERAEARVKELEVLIVNGGIKEMTEEARAILARAKEGDKR